MGTNVYAAETENALDSTGSSSEVQIQPRAGCSNWNLYKKGKSRCTVKQCPGGYKKRERQDRYRQRCVRDDGTDYYNYDYRTVFIACNCR